jgi:hypothetical protein
MEHLVTTRKAVVALAVATVLVVSACSGSDTESTTSVPTPTTEAPQRDLPDLEFGSGVMPFTVPSNFPVPVQSKIATTMIDGSRELTEVVFNIGGHIVDVKAFYTTNLPRLGYEITDVADGTNRSTLSFIGNGIDGELRLTVVGETVTTGTLVFVLV